MESSAGRWADHLRHHLAASRELQALVADQCGEAIEAAAVAIASSLRRGDKLLICGNGGSAADSQHMAAELTCRLTKEFERPGLAAVALTTDTSFLTAYANDFGYEGIFERQVQALGRRGDVLLAISTSGRSQNVRRAVQAARRMDMTTVVLVGHGGRLAGEADHAIVIPSTVTAHVQEAMLPIEHVICHAVEREVFAD